MKALLKDEGGRMKDEKSVVMRQSMFHPSSFILHPFKNGGGAEN
jgi:hypothetical protein